MKQPSSPDSNERRHERMAKHVDETYQTRGVPEEEPNLTVGKITPEVSNPLEHTTSGQGMAPSPASMKPSESHIAEGGTTALHNPAESEEADAPSNRPS